MRESNGPPKRRILLPVLHTSRLSTTTSCTNLHPGLNGHSKPLANTALNCSPTNLMKHESPMTRVYNSLHGKNTPLWSTPLITESPCRSPHCRLYSPSSHPPQARRLRHPTHHNSTWPSHWTNGLPLHNALHMGNNYNQLPLPSPNRPQVTHRLLLSQPHGLSHCRRPNSKPLKLYRGHSTNNRTWPNLLPAILSSKLKLRTSTQPNNTPSPGPTNPTTPNSHLMAPRKPHQPCPPAHH